MEVLSDRGSVGRKVASQLRALYCTTTEEEKTVKRAGSDDALRCSFCHKSQDVVGKLISSPSDYPRAYICDECIAVCNSILEDDRHEQQYGTPHKLPKPLELKEYLDQYVIGQDTTKKKLAVAVYNQIGRAS